MADKGQSRLAEAGGVVNARERGELALCLVALLLSLAAFDAPHPVVLAVPGVVLSLVMLVIDLRRLRDGAR